MEKQMRKRRIGHLKRCMVIKLGISKKRLVYTANDHLKLTARAGYFFVNVRSHRLVKTVIETSVVG